MEVKGCRERELMNEGGEGMSENTESEEWRKKTSVRQSEAC